MTQPAAMSKLGTQLLVPGYHFSMERKEGSLEKWLILRLEERKYMMILEHLVYQGLRKDSKND